MSKTINQKQYTFLTHKISGLTNYEAYLKAYEPKNIERKYIEERASRLLAQTHIKEKYEKMLEEAREELKQKAIISREELTIALKRALDFASGLTEENFIDETVVKQESEGDIIECKTLTKNRKKGINLRELSKIADQIAKLEGFNAPEKQEVNSTVTFVGEDNLED